MGLWKGGKYAVIGIAAFVAFWIVLAVLSFVFSVVVFLFELFVAILALVVTMLVLLGLGYAIVKGLLWSLSEDAAGGTTTTNPGRTSQKRTSRKRTSQKRTSRRPRTRGTDSVDQLTEHYVEGDLSEEEFERRLESELDDSGGDEIDRELERF